MNHSRYRTLVAALLVIPAGAFLVSAQTIKGHVANAVTGDRIAGAYVSVAETGARCTTDVSGAFSLQNLGKGSYTVRAEAEGFLKATKRVFLADPQEVGSSDAVLDMPIYRVAQDPERKDPGLLVQYFFPGHGGVEITVYSSQGAKVRTVVDRERKGGARTWTWDGKNDRGQEVEAGTYSCRIVSKNMVMVRTLELARPSGSSPKAEPAGQTDKRPAIGDSLR